MIMMHVPIDRHGAVENTPPGHRKNNRRYRQLSSAVQMSFFISIMICCSFLGMYAEAFIAPSYHRSTTKHVTSSSQTTRWYVYDDDTNTASDEAEATAAASPSKQNTIVNNSNNEQNNQPSTSISYKDAKKLDLKILLIDNHDSYTYNLYQYISTMTTHPVTVIMNDAFTSYDEFIASLGTSNIEEHYDCIILSPGPGQPSVPTDMGIVLQTIRNNSHVPILGVCLGHQALGYVYGHEVKLAPCGPVHGLMSSVFYNEDIMNIDNDMQGTQEQGEVEDDVVACQLFRDLPQQFDVVRYHSLVVDFPERSDNDSVIEPIAWCNSLKGVATTTDNICMALRHKRYPHYGVQFHPESIGTGEAGYILLRNFCDFAAEYKQQLQQQRGDPKLKLDNDDTAPVEEGTVSNGSDGLMADSVTQRVNGIEKTGSAPPSSSSAYQVFIHKISKGESSLPLPKQVFETMYSSRPNSFWLDSSTASEEDVDDQNNKQGVEGCPITSNSRFSIMGSNDGPLSRKIEYFGREHDAKRQGLRVISNKEERVEVMPNEDILSYLRQKLVDEHEFVDMATMVTFDDSSNQNNYTLQTTSEFGHQAGEEDDEIILPFDYRGGYVGYLGYEVRHDTQCRIFEKEGGSGCANDETSSSETTNPNIPTAAFLFVDRSLLYDHQTGDWYIIGITKNDDDIVCDTISWMHNTKTKLESLGQQHRVTRSNGATSKTKSIFEDNNYDSGGVTFIPNRSKSQYQNDISRSHDEIKNGESYELCVTNQLEAKLSFPKHSLARKANHESPFELYKLLREKNPAPFSAFMNLYEEEVEGGCPGDEMTARAAGGVSICCSSPERFLSVKNAQVTSNKVNGDTTTSNLHHQPSHLKKRQFVVESKPIKGTAARYTNVLGELDDLEAKRLDSQIATNLQESIKDRAENLMIVDLLRNDLGRVCEIGSVHVPKLMEIESFATVHQLVSTVRGTLNGGDATNVNGDATNGEDTAITSNKNVIDVIEACFPGGSMTGAPKQRTMEILHEIEDGVSRGPYSGCLGYISLNGCMDMNIVIRSAVLTPEDQSLSQEHKNDNKPHGNGEEEVTDDDDMVETWKVSVGCGGAITALSDSDDEYEEMLLKSRVVRKTISQWVAQQRLLGGGQNNACTTQQQPTAIIGQNVDTS